MKRLFLDCLKEGFKPLREEFLLMGEENVIRFFQFGTEKTINGKNNL